MIGLERIIQIDLNIDHFRYELHIVCTFIVAKIDLYRSLYVSFSRSISIDFIASFSDDMYNAQRSRRV